MEYLSNAHEDRPNQYENSHKLCGEKGQFLLKLKEKQQHDQNFRMEEKQALNKYFGQKKDRTGVTVRDPSRKAKNVSEVVRDRKIITVH